MRYILQYRREVIILYDNKRIAMNKDLNRDNMNDDVEINYDVKYPKENDMRNRIQLDEQQ